MAALFFRAAIRRLAEIGLKAKGKEMDLLSSIELPHWLMIAGAVFVVVGFLGPAFTRNRQAETNPVLDPTVSDSQTPPPQGLLDSSRRKDNK
ncbi:hypothetical protein [Bradyrhizobium sp. JYMT SZCCT0428]|uniref:hypothetical protein n=1 Tax=Bradyrhizobium sp. JYMT SZCCT0428 TaxID=2807673 RepID=UPI001BA51C4D|nr:hypothetical protein [Bradyrhizobium sp. JYMT SZCCT0428]MBR1155294.1 hypothetical protein [Bradyrhizobium sp. JYMT SZCCT0428]